eukprot:CAMPEP_0194199334 /NCGR_PEP_ID=MMETSP0156-20130528/395_1 /TAXON_ID=33649 /ORGANISM="Thalassionema nitzschioides, Strain L26-B" /LENGTH=349 /DNA_ID=CAMNT_0038924219 /DNA_START=108 /DNA_END=1157 /DNA_ORIENTATION=-
MSIKKHEKVIDRIEGVAAGIIKALDREEVPLLSSESKNTEKCFTLSQSRSFTSALMVLSYCHSLLLSNRSTTTREVYYFFVTHFRNQRECEQAIWDAADLLGVSRISLGLAASPKGWFCGSLKIVRKNNITDAAALSSIQGLPITREWLEPEKDFEVRSNASCILVIEKEGIYNRLSEDRFFETVPCILVTGKGVPDLATRSLVWRLYQQFRLPVLGICDCNPYGIGVLFTYFRGSKRIGVDGEDRYSVPIEWLGLRPSQVEKLRKENKLPFDVYQKLTEFDRKKIKSYCHHSHDFHGSNHERLQELLLMKRNGYKVELEALQWIGVNYICHWLQETLQEYINRRMKGV